MRAIILFAALLAAISTPASAELDATSKSWNQPFEPFRIAGNIYYVGANNVTSYLITTPSGHILLDSGFAETVPQILQNIAHLGFDPRDVKVLLNSHAHFDHAAGLAELKRLTGARFIASRRDAPLLARGGVRDFGFGDRFPYPAIKADRIIDDGDLVRLGGVTMRAVMTPGHTKGCTTWTTKTVLDGKPLDVLFGCSASVPGYTLEGNPQYPDMVTDYRRTFRILESMSPDIFVAPHAPQFSMEEKRERQKRGDSRAFVDPEGYRTYVRESKESFETLLEEQREGTAHQVSGH